MIESSILSDLEKTDYSEAINRMNLLQRQRINDEIDDTLLVLSHREVVTIDQEQEMMELNHRQVMTRYQSIGAEDFYLARPGTSGVLSHFQVEFIWRRISRKNNFINRVVGY